MGGRVSHSKKMAIVVGQDTGLTAATFVEDAFPLLFRTQYVEIFHSLPQRTGIKKTRRPKSISKIQSGGR
jgi:hypothetical protein